MYSATISNVKACLQFILGACPATSQMDMATWMNSSYLKVAVPFLWKSLCWNCAVRGREGDSH